MAAGGTRRLTAAPLPGAISSMDADSAPWRCCGAAKVVQSGYITQQTLSALIPGHVSGATGLQRVQQPL